MQYIKFSDLPVKALFSMNGDKCIKKSTRTAELIEYSRWFYFGINHLCVVNNYCLLDKSYFN